MVKQLKPKFKSVMLSFFLSYLFILMVPLIFGVAIYVKTEDTIEKEINNSNSAMLEQSRQALDVGLTDINRLIKQISINETFRLLMSIENRDLTTDDYYDVYRAVKDYMFYKSFTSYIDDYFIYLPKIDKVLYRSGTIEMQTYFAVWSKANFSYEISYDFWLELISGKHSGKYVMLSNKSGPDAVFYTLKLPAIKEDNPDAIVVIRLSTKEILGNIQNRFSLEGRSVAILDSDNQMLFSAGTELAALQSLKYDDFKGQGTSYIVHDNQKYVISYITSEVARWKYVSVIPFNTFWDKVEYLRTISLVAVSLCMLVGLIVSYLFAKKNYKPIGNLMSILGKKKKQGSELRRNEYKIIQEAVCDTINENRAISKKLLDQNQALLSSFIVNLLKGKMHDSEYIGKMLRAYNISFRFDYFYVLLVYVLQPKKQGCGNYNDAGAETRKSAMSILSNILMEVFDKENEKCFFAECDDMTAFLVNSNNGMNNRQAVVEAVLKAHNIIKNDLGAHVIAALSRSHETVNGVVNAYQQAMESMEYGIITYHATNNPVVIWDNINNLDGIYEYSLETESCLINCIKAADFEGGSNLLNEIYNTNVNKKRLSGKAIKSLVLDINNTIIKAVSKACPDCEDSPAGDINIVEDLMKYDKLQDMKELLQESLLKACQYVKAHHKERNDKLIEAIIEYVEKRYSDKNFGVVDIGYKFGFNPAYIARIFKEHTGECLADFIGRIRVEKAKALLMQENMSIKSIADTVGYLSSNVFIRAFKRYEGVTPGLYKKTN